MNDASNYVPTGYVPRYVRSRPDGSVGYSDSPGGPFADRLAAVIDHQLEIERKARAWDELMRLYARHDTSLLHVDVVRGLLDQA